MRYLLPLVCLLITSFAARATNWYVQAGQSLQPVINQASSGDTITLQAGATFTGNFVLPNKSGTFVDHNSKFNDEFASGGGHRVDPSQKPFMAKLMSPNGGAALSAANGAHNYYIRGLELANPPGVYSMNVVQLGTGGETTVADLPSHIILDRLYIHGDRSRAESGASR